ncbi:branched-chain alpha-keto acid dehydrogenase E2 subunit (lipoamide acyltransferase) [Candidatus Hydrogenisulfobacillus filiaventi]|uniref:Dihydrolipoamide acetyltransferase component of pyruvate dehydrogenase complex n=1 Tax=Candidatus Hydrogenisulfobacillus filiaventi TaxID=2707344 RepID=A0A6F8ZL99_9FIRM|nr:branched-chain alpha-keto acid dehydrogenase E2 subunit (lipoamide acyltransferase) [Candidatus Hydrogenisulfobacillus filiaventi]
MPEIVRMPQLGESVTEGTIGQWLKKAGDHVDQYESLVEVMTDKVNAEVPSPAEGVITRILVEEGATVAVGEPLCELEVAGGAATTAAPAEAAPAAASPPAAPATPAAAEPSAAAPAAPAPAGAPPRGRYSPAVRRLAAEHGIDPATVSGTGAGGRVTRRDILQAVAAAAAAPTPSAPAAPAAAPTPAAPPAAPAPVPAIAPAPAVVEPGDEVVPLSQIRRVIADRMVRSKMTVPHAWLMVEVDVTGLATLRERLKTSFKEREGVPLTFVPFMIRAVVEGLRQVPEMNAQWNGDSIVYKKRINLGMATATDRGLVVPVIKDADRQNVVGLAHQVADLTQRARQGRLTMDDITGGTFTLDNTGAVGTVLTYPVINAPEVGIVTLERIVKRPVVIGDSIAIRSMVNICLSFDHRVVDGAEAGRFLTAVKQHLESIGPETSIY